MNVYTLDEIKDDISKHEGCKALLDVKNPDSVCFNELYSNWSKTRLSGNKTVYDLFNKIETFVTQHVIQSKKTDELEACEAAVVYGRGGDTIRVEYFDFKEDIDIKDILHNGKEYTMISFVFGSEKIISYNRVIN